MRRKVKIISIHFMIAILLCLSALSPDILYSQDIRAGAAYLKILPGTRQQNLAGSLTGSLDGTFSVYANPGATGFLRHWQFSASYTKWIANISHTSLFYGQQFRFPTPLTEKLYVGVGLHRQGFEDFDASGGNSFVNASDMLVSLSLGLPIKGISRNLSVGTNIKYFRSELAQYNASTMVFDAGIIFRTSPKPFNFLFSEQIIFSAGAAVTQMGKPLTFIAQETPLPRTFRAGVAFNLGKHDGLQLQLAADYRKVRDEDGRVGLGLEIINLFGRRSWGRLMTVRGGYIFDNKRDERLFNKFSLGLSFRLDDYINSSRHARKPSGFFKNAALRLDGGFLNSKTFSNIYQGSMTYRPVGPEPFHFVKSDFMSLDVKKPPTFSYQVCEEVKLAWESTKDPDLYDQSNYLVFVAKDSSTMLDELINSAKRNELELKLAKPLRGHDDKSKSDSVQIRILSVAPKLQYTSKNGENGMSTADWVIEDSTVTFYAHRNRKQITFKDYIPMGAHGQYYWTVMTYDRNRHFRVIDASEGHIARFDVKPTPRLLVEIEKRQNQKIAEVRITNIAHDLDRDFLVRVASFDSLALERVKERQHKIIALGSPISKPAMEQKKIIDWQNSRIGAVFLRESIPGLLAGKSDTFQIKLDQNQTWLIAEVDSANLLCANTRDTLALYDLELKKSVEVEPFKPKVIFTPVGSDTLTKFVRAELTRLSRSFKDPILSNVFIKIDGHTDEQGWPGRTPTENDSLNKALSERRVKSVRNFLVDSLKVDPKHILTEGYGQTKLIEKKVAMRSAHLRDSLHRINRRVEMYLIRNRCQPHPPSLISPGHCFGDTLDIVNAGDEFYYVFEVKNRGHFTAKDILIKDFLPEHIIPQDETSLTNGSRYRYQHHIDSLAANATDMDSVKVKVDTTLLDSLKLFERLNIAEVSAANDIYSSNNRDSTVVYVIGGKPPNLEPIAKNVTITGIPRVGEELRGSYTFYDPDQDPQGNSTFRWLRDDAVIPGDTLPDYYVLTENDLNRRIRFEVTPIAQTGAKRGRSVLSASLGPIAPNLPPVVTFVSITGDSKVGQVLKIENVVIRDPEGDPLGTEKLRWLRDGQPIKGANSATYQVRAVDEGKMIAIEVTPIASRGSSPGRSIRSEAIGPIDTTKIKPPQVIHVKVIAEPEGIPAQGQCLKGTYRLGVYNGKIHVRLSWFRNKKRVDSKIVTGEEEAFYKLGFDDVGHNIRFEVIPFSGLLRGKAKSDSVNKIKAYQTSLDECKK